MRCETGIYEEVRDIVPTPDPAAFMQIRANTPYRKENIFGIDGVAAAIYSFQYYQSMQFGSVEKDTNEQYIMGRDEVSVTFRSANPRNNRRLEGPFLTVDMLNDSGDWQTLYKAGDWCMEGFIDDRCVLC